METDKEQKLANTLGNVVKYGQSANPVIKEMLSDTKYVYDNSAKTGSTGGA